MQNFYTLDTTIVKTNTRKFVDKFDGNVIYAVKTNPHPSVLKTIAGEGIYGFDVASHSEIELVRNIFPDIPCHFMNPIKPRDVCAKASLNYGIEVFVIDSFGEYEKMKAIIPPGKQIFVYLRLCIDFPSSAVFELNTKFGLSKEAFVKLLADIRSYTNWNIGVTYHIGSQMTSAQSFIDALHEISSFIEIFGDQITSIDIGGGFPGEYVNSKGDSLEYILHKINRELLVLPSVATMQHFCEPGRALVYNSMSLFSRVILRKNNEVYIANGIYNGLLSSERWIHFPTETWRGIDILTSESDIFKIYGPTCDSRDVLGFTYALPNDIKEGDWIEFKNVGAYSLTFNTDFNGFGKQVVYEASGMAGKIEILRKLSTI